ncbi:MAG: J domain-containing protein [Magnetococcus sp. YQC-5]
MNDHFATLGIAEDANDETVRKAYLQLVRTFPPERDPVRFQEIRAAYDALADSRNRLAYRLFHAPKPDVRPMLASLLQEGVPTPPDEAAFLTVLRESLARLRFTPTGDLESKTC